MLTRRYVRFHFMDAEGWKMDSLDVIILAHVKDGRIEIELMPPENRPSFNPEKMEELEDRIDLPSVPENFTDSIDEIEYVIRESKKGSKRNAHKLEALQKGTYDAFMKEPI